MSRRVAGALSLPLLGLLILLSASDEIVLWSVTPRGAFEPAELPEVPDYSSPRSGATIPEAGLPIPVCTAPEQTGCAVGFNARGPAHQPGPLGRRRERGATPP